MNLDIQGAMKRFSGAIIKPVMFLAVAGILLAVSVILKMEGMPALWLCSASSSTPVSTPVWSATSA